MWLLHPGVGSGSHRSHSQSPTWPGALEWSCPQQADTLCAHSVVMGWTTVLCVLFWAFSTSPGISSVPLHLHGAAWLCRLFPFLGWRPGCQHIPLVPLGWG